ncbi:MAG TPA: cation acetate symporter, partial [Gemmatimonadales bacterium]|nr:cation acetate symporter [Gemmatimonadales bacterium]
VGTVGTLTLIALSPTVQVEILGRPDAWFPLKNPALVTLPASFAAGIAVSWLTARAELRAGYAGWERRMHLGVADE